MTISGWFGPDSGRLRRRRATGTRLTAEVMALEARRLLTLGWTTGVGLPAPASQVGAAPAGDGSIALFGDGSAAARQLAAGATSWTAAGSIDMPRNSPGVAYLGNSRALLVFGGYSINDGSATDSLVRVDAGVATQLTPLNTAREQLAYATDGSFAYAIGGVDANGSLLGGVEQYDPSQDNWNTLADLPTPLAGASAVYDGAGDIYVMGGRTASGLSAAVYELNIGANTWTTVASLPVAETNGAAALGGDGKVYAIGGVGAGGNSLATAQRFDPTTGTWSVDTPMPASLSGEAAVVDTLGRIEVIGGEDIQGGVSTKSAAVYVTDLAPVFTSTAPVNPTFVANSTFTYTASASGTPSPTFSLVNPPAGARINPATGAFAWTPTVNQTGPVTIDIRASNAFSHADQLVVGTARAPAPVGLTVTGSSPSTISLKWQANAGPVAYYRVYMDGQLAQYDIVADKLTGTSTTIAGLASQAGGHTFYVTSFDTTGTESVFSTMPVVGHTWFVGQLQYSPGYLSVAATHQLTFTLSNPTAYPAPTSYAIVGGAPAAMKLNPVTGVVTWLTTNADASQGYFPTFSSTNAAGTSTIRAGIAVQINYPTITESYPGGTGSTAYANLAFRLQFLDGSGAPVTWKLNSGPAGATLSSTGLLSWTPTMAQALASGSAAINVTATNYAGSSTAYVTTPLLTAAAPSNLTYNVNTAAGTIGVYWGAPPVDGSPVASYLVTLTYSYTSGGSGRGGGGSHTYTTTQTITVSGSTYKAAFSGINFAALLARRTRFWISVVALDPSGNHSAAATTPLVV